MLGFFVIKHWSWADACYLTSPCRCDELHTAPAGRRAQSASANFITFTRGSSKECRRWHVLGKRGCSGEARFGSLLERSSKRYKEMLCSKTSKHLTGARLCWAGSNLGGSRQECSSPIWAFLFQEENQYSRVHHTGRHVGFSYVKRAQSDPWKTQLMPNFYIFVLQPRVVPPNQYAIHKYPRAPCSRRRAMTRAWDFARFTPPGRERSVLKRLQINFSPIQKRLNSWLDELNVSKVSSDVLIQDFAEE